ncbi:hypothetical protein [Gillisia marina]|uniref:hypothetical protein n=1 Tax=Gillisia marina TaxID=1167637 RepID=UPI0012DCE0D1|nr:hypothetical protein [Gillisia marina]
MEIIKIIESMSLRGLAYIDFTPESLIITPNNTLFCTGFSFLQKYETPILNIEQGVEITGIPKTGNFDLPKNFDTNSSSFNHVWGPSIGNWESNILKNGN